MDDHQFCIGQPALEMFVREKKKRRRTTNESILPSRVRQPTNTPSSSSSKSSSSSSSSSLIVPGFESVAHPLFKNYCRPISENSKVTSKPPSSSSSTSSSLSVHTESLTRNKKDAMDEKAVSSFESSSTQDGKDDDDSSMSIKSANNLATDYNITDKQPGWCSSSSPQCIICLSNLSDLSNSTTATKANEEKEKLVSKKSKPLIIQNQTAIQPISNLPCGHRFHSVCIIKWFTIQSSDSCPVCRKEAKFLTVS